MRSKNLLCAGAIAVLFTGCATGGMYQGSNVEVYKDDAKKVEDHGAGPRYNVDIKGSSDIQIGTGDVIKDQGQKAGGDAIKDEGKKIGK